MIESSDTHQLSELFEQEVRDLLRLHGWTVTPEMVLGHKKVDAYAEKVDDLGERRRIVVECKCWNRSLTQKEVSGIFANYLPLLQSDLVDTVLVVTEKGVAPSAETYIASASDLRHLTRSQLHNTLIDFRSHINGISMAYASTDAARCYVPQSFKGGESSLEDHLLDWVANFDSRPMAVLGGYGVGKTTLASRLAYLLADRCKRDPTARVPIILPLASIATDQTLEGLLGRQLTSTSICYGYNFPLFQALNARGRFVILLDGFDEMKKTMSWETLIYNLSQLNRLVTPLSKVVLFGRPSAFISDDEHEEALHGRTRRLDSSRRVPGWPDYKELHLQPFSRHQVTQFIELYIAAMPHETQEQLDRRHRVAMYLKDIEGPQGRRLMDLASRPVQLRMLMEVLPEYTGKLNRLTVALLYSEFIDLILRREAEKPARIAFSKEQRARFAARLALWMWEDGQRGDVDANRIPREMFDEFVPRVAADVELNDIKRDLLSGGFLDRRPPNTYYFPHRSFQEFLVADQLVHMLELDPSAISRTAYITPEITSFFLELLGRSGTIRLRKRLFAIGNISGLTADLLKTACIYYDLAQVAESGENDEESTRRGVSENERIELLRRLDIAGVVSGHDGGSHSRPASSTSTKKKTPHRKGGVTRKGKYYD